MTLFQLFVLLPLIWMANPLQVRQESEAAAAVRHIKENTRTGLDSLDRVQDQMENDAARLSKETIAYYRKEKAAIQKQETRLRRKVKEETKVADDKWETFKSSVEKDFRALQQRVDALKEKIKKQLPQEEPPAESDHPPTTLLT
ncbi:hypothetical protein SAMN04488128_103364 [Chitinophaga eiseniae]|uniref:Uncharacterized protein n=1 Tax=Chitinophaga eiseniae TaxID=634771 RepID=A0A1T4SSL4_9BACT|nr:hypothetical protein [Chitinophaga eiseniae]SKA30868.1 hypothetical protein SAMN04488128_103364 [Chitinophaga eiseniae]